jgi:hypothetical protein
MSRGRRCSVFDGRLVALVASFRQSIPPGSHFSGAVFRGARAASTAAEVAMLDRTGDDVAPLQRPLNYDEQLIAWGYTLADIDAIRTSMSPVHMSTAAREGS